MIIMKREFSHEPEYFQFYVSDAKAKDDLIFRKYEYEGFIENGIIRHERAIAVSVVSEFSPILTSIEVHDKEPKHIKSNDFDRIVECNLKIESGCIAFLACPSGQFGTIDVGEGDFKLRIYYGGQNTVELDGSSHDFYHIDMWKS